MYILYLLSKSYCKIAFLLNEIAFLKKFEWDGAVNYG